MASLQLGVLDVGTFTLSLELASEVESLGYKRYWISEHHGEGNISCPTLLVPVIAMLTKSIRVGTAGVLLRFQSPLAVAENFRMLQHAFDGRVDLGVARSPAAVGTEQLLDGRPHEYTTDQHADKVAELQRLLTGRLPEDHPLYGRRIDPPLTRKGPPPIWVMSTSASGARTAATLGTHYCFHDYYAPLVGPSSIAAYRDEFRPSPEVGAPACNVCVFGYCGNDAVETVGKLASEDRAIGRRVFVGTQTEWVGFLREVTETYQTNEVIVQTLFGDYDLKRQVASFARIADAALAV